MLKEHDPVILIEDLPAEGVWAGEFGYIVAIYGGGRDYDVEFFDRDGHTIDVIEVRAEQVRPATDQDIARRIPA